MYLAIHHIWYNKLERTDCSTLADYLVDRLVCNCKRQFAVTFRFAKFGNDNYDKRTFNISFTIRVYQKKSRIKVFKLLVGYSCFDILDVTLRPVCCRVLMNGSAKEGATTYASGDGSGSNYNTLRDSGKPRKLKNLLYTY